MPNTMQLITLQKPSKNRLGRNTKAAWCRFPAKTSASLTVAVSLVASHTSILSCRSRNFRSGTEMVTSFVSNVNPILPASLPSLSRFFCYSSGSLPIPRSPIDWKRIGANDFDNSNNRTPSSSRCISTEKASSKKKDTPTPSSAPPALQSRHFVAHRQWTYLFPVIGASRACDDALTPASKSPLSPVSGFAGRHDSRSPLPSSTLGFPATLIATSCTT